MITWNNLDTLTSFKELENVERVDLVKAMSKELQRSDGRGTYL